MPTAWFWAIVAGVSVVAIFVLPFGFPPSTPSFSSSYEVGFNNRIAALATALISIGVALFLWRRGEGAPIRENSRAMPHWWLGAASLLAVLHTALLGRIVVRADTSFGDAGYFIAQLTHAAYDHATLYRGLEFPYGPLLFYWPMLFVKVLGHAGIGPEAAYMVSLAAMQVAGLVLVFYILQTLPLSLAVRGLALATLTFGTLTPLLGLNYTMFRFTLPYAAILWIARRNTMPIQALLFGLGEILMLCVSSELGIAFAAATAFYALYRAFSSDRRWILLAIVPPVSFALFAACIGGDYFRALGTFAVGSYNAVVDPGRGHVDILIFAAVVLSPFAVAGYVRSNPRTASGVVGMYGASLAMLPSALGRCDALHTFFSGVGLALLALVAVDACKGIWPKIWLTLFVLPALWSQGTQTLRLAPVLRAMMHAPAGVRNFDLTRLEKISQGKKISAPVDLPQPVRRELMRSRQYEPSYYFNMIMVTQSQSEEAKVAEMRRAPFALLPVANYTMQPDITGAGRRSFLNYGYKYKIIHAPYIAGALIEQEVRQHWSVVAGFGDYVLYQQK